MKTVYYRRPHILRKLEPGRGHTVIEASAGTGKTYTLEHLVIDILIRGEAKIEEILVVTFTDAATRELRERVRILIRRLCEESGPLPPGAEPGHYWQLDEVMQSRLREALFRFDGAQISTIHGFCHRVLSEQAFRGGRLFEQEQADGEELFGFSFREEIRRVLVEKSATGEALERWLKEDRSLLQLEQFLYRCHREGCPGRCPVTPVLDEAAFAKEISNLPTLEDLLEAGRSCFDDQGLSRGFAKTVSSLFEALEAPEGEGQRLKTVARLHEWAGKSVQINGDKDSRFNHLRRMTRPENVPAAMAALGRGLERLLTLAADDLSFFSQVLLPRVQERLAARKRALGLLDFDDMLLGVLQALRGREGGALVRALRKRWRYALVDEFQDTDPVQWEIFRRIFVDGTDSHFLSIIGDPKQAIYSFRGADVHTYEAAKEHLITSCGASRLALEDNYRSTETLIGATNEIFTARDSAGRSFFSGLNRYSEPVQCGDRSRLALEGNRAAAPVHLLHLHGGEEELSAEDVKKGVARFIGEEISRLLDPQQGLRTARGGGAAEPIKLSDIYILTRSAAEGYFTGQVLRRFGIPHAFYKQEGLFQTSEADDVYRLLCAIAAPTDAAVRMAAWLTPFFGIELAALSAWQAAGENHPFAAMLHRWKRLADDQAWPSLFEAILTECGLVRRLVFADDERALTNYLHLFELLTAQAHAQPLTLHELARSLKAHLEGRTGTEGSSDDIQRLETDRQAVQILTMHKAKGLQAAVIFISGGFGNPPPGEIRMNIYHREGQRCLHLGQAYGEIGEAVEREIDEENQRLIYVALTRAEARLYLPYFGPPPRGYEGRGRYGYKRLGRLYRELQKQLDLLRDRGRLEEGSPYVLRPVACGPGQGLPGEEKTSSAGQGWFGEELLGLPPSRAREAAGIKPAHRGVLLTSYTRMSRGQAWQAPAADPDESAARRAEEVAAEVEGSLLPAALPAAPDPGSPPERGEAGSDSPESSSPVEALPGRGPGQPAQVLPDQAAGPAGAVLPAGWKTGVMLHSLLEATPAAETGSMPYEQWTSEERVRERAAATLRRHGFAVSWTETVLSLVYRALRTPLRAESVEGTATLNLSGGIAGGERHRPEMCFTYPIPETGHPPLDAAALQAGGENSPRRADAASPLFPGREYTGTAYPHAEHAGTEQPYMAVRGFLQGLIDLVFEHGGRIYLLDWKSDCLPSYTPPALHDHMSKNYSLQARVYSLALLRLLEIDSAATYEATFGGIIYAFIRGLEVKEGEETTRGTWFSRPPFASMAAWEREFIARQEWGGEVIRPRPERVGRETKGGGGNGERL